MNTVYTARTNNPNPDQFLNRLKWQTTTGEFKGMRTMKVDVCKFVFDEPLDEHTQYDFVDFMSYLNYTNTYCIIQMYIWLTQHGVKFRLVFEYDRTQPFIDNLRKLRYPAKLRKGLLKEMDDVLAYDLSRITNPLQKGDVTNEEQTS